MPVTVQLSEIVDALEMQFDEYSSFLDLDTGHVESSSIDLLREAEESGDDAGDPDLAGWEEDELETAKRIVSTDRFVQLPTKHDVHDWSIMEEFALSVKSGPIREELLHALHGSGAFRHFKDTVRRHGIESAWFEFRTEALREIARDWCEENQIAWK